jgi:hypothetical protein
MSLRRVKKNRQEDFGSILSHNPELEGYLQSVRGRPKGHQPGCNDSRFDEICSAPIRCGA